MKRVLGGLWIVAMLCLGCACHVELPHPDESEAPVIVTTASTAAPTTTTTTTTTTVPTTTTATAPEPEVSDPDVELWNDPVTVDTPSRDVNNLLVMGRSAYEYYAFSEGTADEYIAALNSAGEQLKGRARVYDIIIPTAIGVMLPADVRADLGLTEQADAIDYMYGHMNDTVIKVPLIDILRTHNSEALYYHTDHHWSSRAAYYAYASYMLSKGATPKPLASYDTMVFPGFYGTLYEMTGADLREDTVVAYLPASEHSMFFEDSEGNRTNWHVITDVSGWGSGSKYLTFIGGDNAFTEITNEDLHDGSAAVVIKESFGNAFVPFLLANYGEIHVIDYRYWKGSLTEFVRAKGVKDVIYLNNTSATRNLPLVKSLDSISR